MEELLDALMSIKLDSSEVVRNIIIYRDHSVAFLQTNKYMYSYNKHTKTYNDTVYEPMTGSIILKSPGDKKKKLGISLLRLY